MATTISTQDIVDAKRDIDDIGKAVNEKVIVSPRYGEDFKSLPMIADEAQATIGEWESAIALITQEGGVPALAVSDASGKTQQQINDETPRLLDLAELTGANLLGYSPQELYDINTVGGALNAAVGNRIYLMSYIPKAEHASILNGTSTYDASAAIASALADTIAKNATLVLPDGQVSFSSFPNVKTAGFKMVGQGSSKTKLKYTGTEVAVSFNAFASGSPTDPFLDGYSVGAFHIVGDTLTTGLFAQGIARSFFSDIMVNGSNMLDGTVAFRFSGVMLSVFNNLKTSYPYGNTPYRGLQLTAGTRNSISVGACSNNVFIGCYAEGNSIGWQLASNGADQNTFIGGSPEACKVYGLVVGTSCRYNTFIGVGAENSAESVTADISDGGIYSRYTGCYSAKSVRIGSNSRGIRIESGYFERIEIQANARATVIDQVTVNNWNTGSGGLVDLGFDTAASRVADAQTGEFIYVRKARFSVTVGASPFLWENTHQVPVKVRVQGGTVTNTQIRRGADSWTEPNPAAAGSGTGNVGIYLLMPGDKLETSYSAAPAISVAVMPM